MKEDIFFTLSVMRGIISFIQETVERTRFSAFHPPLLFHRKLRRLSRKLQRLAFTLETTDGHGKE